MMKNWIRPSFGELIVTDITPIHVSSFFARLRAKKLSSKYQQNLYALLKLLFELAEEHGLALTSPVRRRLHRPRTSSKDKATLSVEEIRLVLAHVEPEWQVLFVCLALTGLRAGEVLGLRWKDIDWISQTLSVNHALWRGKLYTPKTQASRKTLHLPSVLASYLRGHQERSQFMKPEDFVSCRADGTPPDPDYLRRSVLYPAMDTAKIERKPRQYGFHVFRHSAATIVHRETGSVKLAQRQLRHSRASTTSDVYIHPNDEEAKAAASALARSILPDACPLLAHPQGSEVELVH